MSIGQDLLDVPFAEMVSNLATAIADGQLALDRSSIETLDYLRTNTVALIPEITEVIKKSTRSVDVGTPTKPKTVDVAGVDVTSTPGTAVPTSLLQAGILPTFYQFTEAQIEVKLSISMKSQTTTEASGTTSRPARLRFAAASPVNYRTKNTYSYDAQGSSTLRVTMKPVPPPSRLLPDIVTVNTLTDPATVTRNER